MSENNGGGMDSSKAIKIIERMIEAHDRLASFADSHKYSGLSLQIKEDSEALSFALNTLKKKDVHLFKNKTCKGCDYEPPLVSRRRCQECSRGYSIDLYESKESSTEDINNVRE